MKRILVMVFVMSVVALIFPVRGECQPQTNLSSVSVYRDDNTVLPFFKMEIYIDDRKAQSSYKTLFGAVKYNDINISRGETVSIPINDGTHSIYIKAGPGVSNTIVFSVERSIVAFVITFDGDNNIILTEQ